MQHVETCKGECTKQCERKWEVREVEEGTEVLELRERQLRNVPEELGWWYRVDSKTMGRFCNRCTCWLPREEWDLRNWKSPVDTEAKVDACMNYIDRNQRNKWPIRKCTERHSEVLAFDLPILDSQVGTRGLMVYCISMGICCRNTLSIHMTRQNRKFTHG